MFVQTIPAVAVILIFLVSIVIQSLPVFWLTAWWLTGCLCAIVLSYVKGETFGGGIRYIISFVAIGCLGFTLVPFTVPATFLAVCLIPRKWTRAAERREKRIAQWVRVGYPQNEEFKDLWLWCD